jgi:hypothetical protein
MTNQELVDTLVTAAESMDIRSNIPMAMLLKMAADRIEELNKALS